MGSSFRGILQVTMTMTMMTTRMMTMMVTMTAWNGVFPQGDFSGVDDDDDDDNTDDDDDDDDDSLEWGLPSGGFFRCQHNHLLKWRRQSRKIC